MCPLARGLRAVACALLLVPAATACNRAASAERAPVATRAAVPVTTIAQDSGVPSPATPAPLATASGRAPTRADLAPIDSSAVAAVLASSAASGAVVLSPDPPDPLRVASGELVVHYTKAELLRGHAAPSVAGDSLVLHVRLTNATAQRVGLALQTEWFGGLAPGSPMHGWALQPDGSIYDAPVYLAIPAGRHDSFADGWVRWIAPRASIDLRLRLDWPGTGSRPMRHRLVSSERAGRFPLQIAARYRREGHGPVVTLFPPVTIALD